MCLDSLEVTKPAPEGVGYKVFRKPGRLLRGELTEGSRKTKTWLVASFSRVIRNYPLGFHIFTDLEVAKRWACWPDDVTRKVKYRKAHTRGLQGQREVIVANEIYIYPGQVR